MSEIKNLVKTLALGAVFFVLAVGCGIRGAPIPPSKPNLYQPSYEEYIDKKEMENEQKNKFRSGHSLNNAVQGK